jgi:acyl-ACP thioesterase
VSDRRFSETRRVFLGDASVTGRLRLDALAQLLQDVAANDAEDAEVVRDRGWVLRRMDLEVRRLPAIYEDVVLTTWCSGFGSRWAERSTTIADTRALDGGVCVQAKALWVYIDLTTGAPVPLSDTFHAIYGGEDVPRVRARLHHPGPPADAKRRPWPLRVTDFDVFGHVNNAVYWTAVEDELASWLGDRHIGHCEVEYRAGIDPGDVPELLVVAGDRLSVWFVVDDEVRASAVVHAA